VVSELERNTCEGTADELVAGMVRGGDGGVVVSQIRERFDRVGEAVLERQRS
jgi:hypothetical protein